MLNLIRTLQFPSLTRPAQAKSVLAVIVVVLAIVVGAASYAALTSLTPEPTAPNPDPSAGSVLLVDGSVQRSLNLTMDEITAMPGSTVDAEIYCLPSPGSSGFLVEEGNWTGVRLGLVLRRAGVSPEAVKVAFYAEDGFIADLDMATAMREDVILAYEKDGKPLREKLRLVVPGNWGYKWIKMLTHIELMNYDFKGTYESRGFPDNAEITANN